MAPSNPPRRHHFMPVFYLKRWAGVDGCLEQFRRLAGREIKPRRSAPAATGYRDDLYAMPGLSADLAQQVEKLFMQEVDSLAAAVLPGLESGGPVAWTSESRTAWARFVRSLQLRTPADVAGVKQRAQDDWGVSIPLIQETYESLRRAGEPMTFEEFVVSKDPSLVERAALKILTRLIDDPGLGAHVMNMEWEVIDLRSSPVRLLTSDCAVEQIEGLAHPDAFMTLPIGPTRLFIAANRRQIIDRLKVAPAEEVVKLRNTSTVCYARDFVWARDRAQADYICDRLGSFPTRTLGERLAAREEDLVAEGADSRSPSGQHL